MPERAVGNAENISGFRLHAATLVERILQQRALDAGNVVLHSHTFGKGYAAADLGQSAASGGGRGTGFGSFRRKFDMQFFGGFERDGTFDRVFQLAHVSWPFVLAEV